MMAAIKLIADERQRQKNVEGWTEEHDDEHTDWSLSRAAAAYAYEASRTDRQREDDVGEVPTIWPWDPKWWKPTDRRRDLVKAGALIVAELERLNRQRDRDEAATERRAEGR
jgi:hypothetical protein